MKKTTLFIALFVMALLFAVEYVSRAVAGVSFYPQAFFGHDIPLGLNVLPLFLVVMLIASDIRNLIEHPSDCYVEVFAGVGKIPLLLSMLLGFAFGLECAIQRNLSPHQLPAVVGCLFLAGIILLGFLNTLFQTVNCEKLVTFTKTLILCCLGFSFCGALGEACCLGVAGAVYMLIFYTAFHFFRSRMLRREAERIREIYINQHRQV